VRFGESIAGGTSACSPHPPTPTSSDRARAAAPPHLLERARVSGQLEGMAALPSGDDPPPMARGAERAPGGMKIARVPWPSLRRVRCSARPRRARSRPFCPSAFRGPAASTRFHVALRAGNTGTPHDTALTWDSGGEVLLRVEHRRGTGMPAPTCDPCGEPRGTVAWGISHGFAKSPDCMWCYPQYLLREPVGYLPVLV
jgi:hypothetical protein